jgi:hypothetical protein
VKPVLGPPRLESTGHYLLGVEVEDALEISKQTGIFGGDRSSG